MSVHRNLVRLFTLALAATALGVGTSSAQEFQGKFTLSNQAQWGKVMLQPGDYTLTLTRFQGGQSEVIVRSEAKGGSAAMFAAASHNSGEAADKSALVCIRQGGTLAVRALEVGPLGETIYFPMAHGAQIYAQAHGEEHPLMAMGPQLIQRVAVK